MKLILAGGFLGSGKTTAIVNASRYFMGNGKRVAVITNDQGEQQVDSAFVKSLGITTREVANGCFCCRLDELTAHLQSLELEHHPAIIFAEPVGSCTDLVATIAKPLTLFHHIDVVISAFADAAMLVSLMEGKASFLEEEVRYIYKKQLEEADIIVLNKIDLVTEEQLALADATLRKDYPGKGILHQNSLDERDIAKWLKRLNEMSIDKSRKSLSVDYNIYGEGEAKMAWLDKRVTIQSPLGNGVFIARQIIRSIFNELNRQNLTIGHLKFFIETAKWSDKVSLTTANTSADFRMRDEQITAMKLLVNARVQTDPETLKILVDHALRDVKQQHSCTITSEGDAAFKPGFPRPTHRMA